MQIGVMHIVGGLIGLFLIVAGSFTVGTKWNSGSETQAASVASAASEMSTTTEEVATSEEAVEEYYEVVKVIDGDTITIKLGGKNETIRLIGIDTPETNDTRTGVQCFGKEATTKLKSVIGDRVSIEKDAGEGERDKYNRLLAYVYNEEGTMLNNYLIAQGYAYEYTYDDAYKYQEEFKAAETAAKKNNRGLWAPDACPPLKTAAPKAMAQPAAAAAAPIPPIATTTEPPPEVKKEPEVKMSEPTQEEKKKEPEPEPEPEKEVDTSSYTCSENKYNCSSFKTQAEAQAVFEMCGGMDNDIHRLDGNKDGEVCEALP